jgi:hypothetical protein
MNFWGGPTRALDQLNSGLTARIKKDTEFQLKLFNKILELLRQLENCPEAVAALPAGTAGALTITQAELTEFIGRLSNPNNMGDDAVKDIVDPIARIGRYGDNSLRRTPGLAISGPARAVPRAPRPGSPEEPGSYKPPATGGPPSYLSMLGFGSRKAPAPAGTDPFAGAIESSNPLVNNYRGQPPNATIRNSISGSELDDDLNSRFGGSRRKTRRARKYRNRT